MLYKIIFIMITVMTILIMSLSSRRRRTAAIIFKNAASRQVCRQKIYKEISPFRNISNQNSAGTVPVTPFPDVLPEGWKAKQPVEYIPTRCKIQRVRGEAKIPDVPTEQTGFKKQQRRLNHAWPWWWNVDILSSPTPLTLSFLFTWM